MHEYPSNALTNSERVLIGSHVRAPHPRGFVKDNRVTTRAFIYLAERTLQIHIEINCFD